MVVQNGGLARVRRVLVYPRKVMLRLAGRAVRSIRSMSGEQLAGWVTGSGR
jgi:hypothetical protein